MSFHYASLSTSGRLKRAMRELENARDGLTGWAWCQRAKILNPGTVASELNVNLKRLGSFRRVVCKQERTKDDGTKVFRYRIVIV